jgi:RNA polymerase sigma factor (TIGR02999 family)
MTGPTTGEVTRLLDALNAGEEDARESLIPIVYQELRALASAHMRAEGDGHTLQPTALVHEAYFRLVGQRVQWHGRSHFFAIAAQAMRRILVDHARKRKAARRGGGRQSTLMDHHAIVSEDPVDLIALDDALERLRTLDERQARTVELRFFGGLEVKETAEVLGVSEITVKRDWRSAKAWLYRELSTQPEADET